MMFENGFIEHRREVTGEDFIVCSVCGMVIGRDEARLLERAPTPTNPPMLIWVCAKCQHAIELGEIDLDWLLQPLDEIG